MKQKNEVERNLAEMEVIKNDIDKVQDEICILLDYFIKKLE